MQAYVPELAALAVIAAGAVAGAARGFLMTVYSLLKFAGTLVLAALLYPFAKMLMPAQSGWEAGAAALLALLVAAVALGLTAKVLRLVDKIPVVHSVNRISGAVAGAALGATAVLAALAVICLCCQAEWCRGIYSAIQHSRSFQPLIKLLYDTLPVLHGAGIPL